MMKLFRIYSNIYDYFIIFVIASLIIGTIQYGIISHLFVLGLICLPFALKEICISFRVGKMQTIVFFMFVWMLYAFVSIFWAPKNQYLFRELWILCWNIIIFIGVYHFARYANNLEFSLFQGWRILILLTLIVAFWEILTDSHIPGFGDFNAESEIATASGESEHRIFAAVTYKNLNSYVTLLCMALPFLLYGFFILSNKILSIVVIVGSVCVLLINSSRGGLLCLVIDILIFVLFYGKLQFPNKKLITVIALVLIIIFIYKSGLIVAAQAIGRLSAYGIEDIMSDEGRWDVWKMGLNFCVDSFGLGWGVGSMQPMYASTGFWLHYSHNFVIEFIMQYGLWLFIPFALMLLKKWFCLIKMDNISQKMLGWMLLSSFVPLVIIDDSYIPHTFVWIWLVTQFVFVNYLKINNE